MELQAMKSPDGSRAYPGKTCRDLKSCFSALDSGEFAINHSNVWFVKIFSDLLVTYLIQFVGSEKGNFPDLIIHTSPDE